MQQSDDGIAMRIARERYLHTEDEISEYDDLRARYHRNDVGLTVEAINAIGTITALPVTAIVVSLYMVLAASVLGGPFHIADLLLFIAVVPAVGIILLLVGMDRELLSRMREIRPSWVLCIRHKDGTPNTIGRVFWLAICLIPAYFVMLVPCIHFGLILW